MNDAETDQEEKKELVGSLADKKLLTEEYTGRNGEWEKSSGQKKIRLRWAGHVARMGESRNAYRVLVGRPEGKRPLGRPRRRWEDNIKMDLREVGYDDREWINLAQYRDQWRAYVRAAMNIRVESFVIDQAELDEESRLETSKFLLSPEDTEHAVDPETQARLEALLEAAGKIVAHPEMSIPVDNMELGSFPRLHCNKGISFFNLCNCSVEDKINTMSLKKPKTSKRYE
ncbi:hypothetical protein ANN_05607 [Periplaneta americana]|uniref:Uncharacterized protein n=1 Tax=Periplaneta americana TaxID=6978 RepID=A0ABQ8TD03_PERAM|nr:hypothetical protein ANN_05607 [Periplaneta americana]